MLASLLGIRLILLLGKAIPLPAPYDVTRALSHVKVINEGDGNDGFQITFTLGKDTVADYGLLAGGALDPDQRVAIALLLGASLEPLVNGVIYNHQVTPSNEPGMSTLTVTGRDVSVLLDLEEKNEQYKNQPDFLIVNRVLAGYAADGVLPPYQVPRLPGVTGAYWGPENRLGLPQPALSVSLGHATNVTSLSVTQDALAPV